MDSSPTKAGRSWRKKLLTGIAFGTLLALAVIEVALRLFPGLLSAGLADQVYSRYRVSPGGIYYAVRGYPLRFCWPGFRVAMYSHGYRWLHETDFRGFRNPPGVATELLLLGDSQIYGHGVEEPQTAAAVLRQRFGRGAYNMGRQGDCLRESYVLTRLFLSELKPRDVVVFVHFNDFEDLLQYKEGAITAPELEWDYQKFRRMMDDPAFSEVFGTQMDRLLTVRLAKGLYLASTQPLPVPAPFLPDRPPLSADAMMAPERFRLATEYYRQMLPKLADVCQEGGAQLHVVYLSCGLPDVAAFDRQAAGVIKEICDRDAIPFGDTEQLITVERILPGDGHLTAMGHEVLAEWLDGFLRREQPERTPTDQRTESTSTANG